ncbi:MAG: hypothetical protein ACYC8T_27170 [Myxococcaceae bacterium]
MPDGLVLHFADVPAEDRTSWGALPITGLVRTLNDCKQAGVEEQFLHQAVRQALSEGHLLRSEVPKLHQDLRRFVPTTRKTRR